MIPNRYTCRLLLSIFAGVSPIPASISLADEPDLSCVDQDLRERIQLSQQYREYDIVIRNACAGAVFWAMCIQPFDPWTYAITGEHTPSGQVAAGDTARVNLMMQQRRAPDSAESKYESFYLNLGYGVSSVPRVECVARECEQKKAGWRAERAGHENSWRTTTEQLDQEVARQCRRQEQGW